MMKTTMVSCALLATCLTVMVVSVAGDMYIVNGANNHLNERSNNVAQDTRMCDTENADNAGRAGCEGGSIFYLDEIMNLGWTAQHGAAGFSHTEILWQWMCRPDITDGVYAAGAAAQTRRSTNAADAGNDVKGLHEELDNYLRCQGRRRNQGLFRADQGIPNNSAATRTRQDNTGQQHGYECPEERDYYPYWAFNGGWVDDQMETTNTSACDYYLEHSQNTAETYWCDGDSAITQSECEANTGTWRTSPPLGMPEMKCTEAPRFRDVHHGSYGGPDCVNGEYGGCDTDMFTHNFTITQDMLDLATPTGKCVVRVRYNTSTADYDGWATFSDQNGAANSPIVNDPTFNGGFGKDLQLQVATDQFGRTFQDRTHAFSVAPRPANVPAGAKIHHISDRGRSGNNQQLSPFHEIDYQIQKFVIPEGDWIHVMMCQSDYEPDGNDNPGDDQYRRSSLAEQDNNDRGELFPRPIAEQTIYPDIATAHEGYYMGSVNGDQLEDADDSHMFLFPAPPQGQYHIMSPRQNQFTNRDQQGTIIVGDVGLSVWEIVAIVAGGAVVLAGLVTAGLILYARSNPHSRVGAMVNSKSLMSGSSAGHSAYTSSASASSSRHRNGSTSKRSAGGRSSRSNRSNRSR